MTLLIIAVVLNTLAVLYIASSISEMRTNLRNVTTNSAILHKDLAELCLICDMIDGRLKDAPWNAISTTEY
jgi:hypothetical protein